MASLQDILRLRNQNRFGPGAYADAPPDPMMTGEEQPFSSVASAPMIPQAGIPRVNDSAPQFGVPQSTEGGANFNQIARLKELYNPEVEATKRFADLLAAQPERGRSSLARTIVASGIGLKGGVKGANEVLDAPHDRAMNDWKAKVEPAYQAANLERYSNANERQTMSSIVNAEAAQRKLDETQRQALAREEVARDRNAIQWFKTRNPNWKYDTSGEFVIALNPADPNKSVNTGIKTGNLSELDKIELNQENALERIGAQHSNAVDLEENVRQPNRIEIINERANNPTSPSQLDDARKATIQAAIDHNPNWARWVDMTTMQIKPAPTDGMFRGASAEDKKDYDDFREAIGLPRIAGTTRQSTPQSASPPQASRRATPGRRTPGRADAAPATDVPLAPAENTQPQQISFNAARGLYRGTRDGGATWVYSKNRTGPWHVSEVAARRN